MQDKWVIIKKLESHRIGSTHCSSRFKFNGFSVFVSLEVYFFMFNKILKYLICFIHFKSGKFLSTDFVYLDLIFLYVNIMCNIKKKLNCS